MLLIVLVVARSLKKREKPTGGFRFRCLSGLRVAFGVYALSCRWFWFFLFQLIGGLARRIAASEVLTGELDPNDKSRTTGRNQASQNHRCELRSDVKILWLFVRHLRLRKGFVLMLGWRKLCIWKSWEVFVAHMFFLKMCVQENVLLQKLPRPQQCESLVHLVVRLLPFVIFVLHIGKYTMLPTTLENFEKYQSVVVPLSLWT